MVITLLEKTVYIHVDSLLTRLHSQVRSREIIKLSVKYRSSNSFLLE